MSPIAKSTLNTTICSTWPSATDFAMFSGKISVMSCVAVCGETFRVCAAAAHMNRRISDQHRERGNNFKIDQRLDAEAPDFFQIRVARDANDENAEKQWRDDDFNEAKKNRAENLQVDRDGRPIVAKFSARKKADENPSRQRAARSTVRGDKKDGQPAQKAWDQRGQRQDLRAREQRCRDGNRCCGDCRGKKFVFHRHPAKKFIGAERYAG